MSDAVLAAADWLDAHPEAPVLLERRCGSAHEVAVVFATPHGALYRGMSGTLVPDDETLRESRVEGVRNPRGRELWLVQEDGTERVRRFRPRCTRCGERQFIDPRHRAVFAAIGDCMLADIAADPVTVLGEMRRAGSESCMTDDRRAGVFLADLMAAAPVVASAGHYARVVVEHSARRRLVEAAERLRQVAERAPLDTVRDVALEEWTALSDAFNRLDPATPRGLARGPVQVVA